jgi:hypothetical protein
MMFHHPQLFSRSSSAEMSEDAIRGPGRILAKPG